ncbi:MAG: DNA damage-inducible protein D [Lentisphaeraceae bacterium]|nr:DNA damage-inducible protein D [Lentisphaeraceae bacterium]
MSDENLERRANSSFEELKHLGEDQHEFWYARDLQEALGYSSWDKFQRVIQKAITACETSGQQSYNHFSQVGKMVVIGSGSQREIIDFVLSRYACYLIVQNGDPSKEVIANGQTYFALQTRRQELFDDEDFQRLKEEEQRLYLRHEIREHNKQLVETAQKSGVETNLDFAIFQNHGYKGLYGGLDAKAIHQHKALKKSQQILDNMGSTELAANLFRATQAEEKLRRENIQGKSEANNTHFEVGRKVRQTIEELGGTMPEDLPTPEEDLKKIERRVKSAEKEIIQNNGLPKKLEGK